MGEIITYETLYEILRKEKYEKELQKLDINFFNSVIKYLEEKEAIFESQKNKTSLFSKESDKTQKQLENVKKILKEIYEKRENKIVQLALISSRFNEQNLPNMLNEEIKFYNELQNILNKYRKFILENLLSKKLPDIKEEIKENKIKQAENIKEEIKLNKLKIVRFLQAVPQFIGDDLILYGPFEGEDVASLPEILANLLIKKNKVQEISTS